MALIETTTYRLVEGADDAAYLAADRRLQTEVVYQQPGLMRRTVARGHGERAGEWIVIELWHTAEDADGWAARRSGDATAQAVEAFVDQGSRDVRRYDDLG